MCSNAHRSLYLLSLIFYFSEIILKESLFFFDFLIKPKYILKCIINLDWMETAFVEEKEEWVGRPMLAVFLKSALKYRWKLARFLIFS